MIGYIPTIDEHDARFNRNQLCYTNNRFIPKVLPLNIVKKQIRDTLKFRKNKGFELVDNYVSYSYRRVKVEL